jgi:hypothetical protein
LIAVTILRRINLQEEVSEAIHWMQRLVFNNLGRFFISGKLIGINCSGSSLEDGLLSR